VLFRDWRESSSNVLIEVAASGLKKRSFNPRRKTARHRAVFVFGTFLRARLLLDLHRPHPAYNVPLIALHVEVFHG